MTSKEPPFDLKRFSVTFAASVAACVGFSVIAGSSAHLVCATASQELYLLAIGDHLLPGSPVESMVLGPLIIGAFVSWWFGLAASPIVYATSGGPRADWKTARIVGAGVVGLALSATSLLATSFLQDDWQGNLGVALLVALLNHGYLVLAIGLITMALVLRRKSGIKWIGAARTSSPPRPERDRLRDGNVR